MKRNRETLNVPIGFDKRWIERALLRVNQTAEFDARLNRVSEMFLGRPYVENSLGGGPERRELFTALFDRFDCVTYVETVVALSCSKTATRFMLELRHLRYGGGTVDWFRRNHFMTGWLKTNIARGAVADLTRGRDTISKTRVLKGVAGVLPKEVTFRIFPKRCYSRARSRMRTGDLIMFVSTRRHLDVFHMGILIREDDRVRLRHATRSAGKIIEQDLTDFLSNNRMSGFILARPLCRR